MSVLSFPRVYFRGFMGWDPCTFNNNDFSQDPTYAAAASALNWPFLATQGPTGITPENFRSTLRPWAITFQPGPSGPSAVPCEWNMFGSHAVDFVQYEDNVTTITGGATGPFGMITSDPLVGGPVAIGGNQGTPPVLVDTNPVSFWSSQVYWGSLSFGSGNAVISGPMNFRMHSRWVNPFRLFGAGGQAATGFACCMQTGIPFDQVTWPTPGISALADALREAASQPGAQGIMVRFTAYVQQYFQNGVFNDIPIQPQGYEELAGALARAWAAWDAGGSTDLFFSNPAYSNVVGVIGVWNDGELASAPGGRYLVPRDAIAATGPGAPADDPAMVIRGHMAFEVAGPTGATAPPPPPPTTPLGPVVAAVDDGFGIISLDFGSAIPETGLDLTKADFGPLSLGVLSGGVLTPIGTIDYPQYATAAYQASAGIIDLPLPPSVTGPIGSGTLVIQASGQTALMEQLFTAQTDSRGIYLDQTGATAFDVTVCRSGVPSPGANVLVARYGPGPQTPPNYGNLNLVPFGPTAPTGAFGPTVQVVNFTNGDQGTMNVGGVETGITVVQADGSGVAEIGIAAQAPGFMVLGFFPYPPGGPTPTPPQNLAAFAPPWNEFVTSSCYTTIRVLPFDDDVPQAFVDLWNSTHDPNQAWSFIYQPTLSGGGILYLYDMLFSVMLEHVDLGSKTAVEANIGPIWSVIAPDSASEGSWIMPITRDLSAGKRLALQLWIYLAANGYNVPNLTMTAIDGWGGPTAT